jgi:hypothetical protein
MQRQIPTTLQFPIGDQLLHHIPLRHGRLHQ